MDDEHDDYREREESAEAEIDREQLGETEEPSVPEEPEEPEEPVYTPQEYQLAQEIKAKRLFKEENNRFPHNAGELSYFLMKANIERPLRPEDDDLQAARRKLEAAGS